MRFKKAIKKIAALGTGATMIGATIMGAMAADLSSYPAPFISEGKFNGVLVVGDKAAAEDVIGVSDIAISLQAAAVKKVSSGAAGAIEVEGDAWKIGTSTKILEMSESLNDAGAINRETIRNITTFIDDAELDALASGEIVNNKGTAPYDQFLYLLGPGTGPNSGYVIYSEDDQDVTADFLYFKSGEEIGRYLLEFTTQLESDVDDSAGSASSTGLFLTDFEDIDLTLFGKKYTIVQARRTDTTGDNIKLILMGGATKDTLLEGNTKTYNIGGTDYEVTLNFVDADEAQFVINAESTRKLKDGDTDKLSDGTTIGVSDILYQDYAGGIHSATFFIGAQKLELKDTDITDVASSNSLKVDDETIDDALVIVEGTDDNSTFKLTRININMTADDDFFVPAGGKLSENPDLDEPEVIFTNNWDFEYQGLAEQPLEEIRIDTSGTKKYELQFKDGNGDEVELPLVEAVAASALEFGEKDKALINQENKTITKDDYIILTDTTQNRGERKSYALQYKGADKSTTDSPVLKFKNLGTGDTIEQTYSNATTTDTGTGDVGSKLATLKIGGADYNVYSASNIAVNDFNILVDLDASGGICSTCSAGSSNNTVNITTFYGMEIGIQNQSTTPTSNGFIVSFKTPDSGRDGGSTEDNVETLQATDYVVNITSDSNSKVNLAEVSGYTSGQFVSGSTNTRHSLRTPDGETDVAYGYTSYGAFIKLESPTSDPDILTIEYPMKQREALVYITTKGTAFSETAPATGDAVTIQRIEVGATKLASEVTDITAVNSILVGGPCANAAASTVMGSPADCTAGFTPGVGKIQLFDVGDGNVAMLVAGYVALDTRNAATVVANYKDYSAQLKGGAVEVRKVANQLTVAAPVAAAPAPVEEPPEETPEETA